MSLQTCITRIETWHFNICAGSVTQHTFGTSFHLPNDDGAADDDDYGTVITTNSKVPYV
jgi:hypothetical protein